MEQEHQISYKYILQEKDKTFKLVNKKNGDVEAWLDYNNIDDLKVEYISNVAKNALARAIAKENNKFKLSKLKTSYSLIYQNKTIFNYMDKKIVEEAMFYFILIDYDLNKFEGSKYFKLEKYKKYHGKGSIVKQNDRYKLFFSINARAKCIGHFKDYAMADEAREYFVSINYDLEKYKKSKYWLEIKETTNVSENYICKGWVSKYGNNWSVLFGLKNKTCYLGSYSTKRLAEKVRKYFISINYDIELFKKSNYYTALRNIYNGSKEYIQKGRIREYKKDCYQLQFYIKNKQTHFGCYKGMKLVEEARDYAISINFNLDKFKESKYWKELRLTSYSSDKYVTKGSVKEVCNHYVVSFSAWRFEGKGKRCSLGTYATKELAEEVRQYFININYDMEKFKESKYWKELRCKKD